MEKYTDYKNGVASDVISEYQLSNSFLQIKEYVKLIKKDLKKQFAELGKPISLYIFRIGDDSASEAYVKGKVNDGKELGVDVSDIHINKDSLKELSLKKSIQTTVKSGKMNRDFLKGIIVQLPLPDWAGMTAEKVKTLISSRKLIKNINLNVTRSGEVVEAIKNIAKKYNNFKWVLIETIYGGYKQRIIKHFNSAFEYFSPNALNDYKRMKK